MRTIACALAAALLPVAVLAQTVLFGVLIADVRDPLHMRALAFIPCKPCTRCPYLDIDPQRRLLIFGNDPFRDPRKGRQLTPEQQQAEASWSFYDVSDPATPRELGFLSTLKGGVVRGMVTEGRYLYGCAQLHPDSYELLTIVDFSDPRRPRKLSEWHVPRQLKRETPEPRNRAGRDGKPQTLRCHIQLPRELGPRRRRRRSEASASGCRRARTQLRRLVDVPPAAGRRRHLLIAAALFTLAGTAAADPIPSGWQAKDVKPVAYLNLRAQRGFKLTMKKTDAGRWYLFVGTTTPGGFHVIDVTDPAKPVIVKVIESQRGSAQVTSAGNLLLLGAQLPFTDRGTPRPFRQPAQDLELVTLWDIKDPLNPQRLSGFSARGWGTHRNGYFGGKYAYLAAFVAGYQGQSILLTLDVSDPRNPREVGRWWWPGQRDNDGVERIPTAFHGAPVLNRDGTMMTLAYAPGIVNLDVRDAANAKIIGRIDFSPLTQVGPPSMHTALQLPNDYVFFSTEPEKPGCESETLAQAGVINNRDPANPLLVARFDRPKAPPGAPYKTFCELKGRFGLHNVNAETHLSITEKPAKRMFATYFLGGLRVYDISNPLFPAEVAYFVPPIPDWDKGHRGVEDVLVDTRGYVYMTNGAEGGIWVVRYTGAMKNH